MGVFGDRGQVRFGDCVIDPLARTVLRGAQQQEFEPKVFDLVVYLILNRHRVVTKRELLDQVWGRRIVVTDGVVARTVMKGRRLIGDDAREPMMIKTVHRVGYRFAAEIELDQGTSAAGTPAAHLNRAEHVRIAVLPVRNETQQPEYAWIDLGLMSSTVEAMRDRHAVDAVSVADVLAVVGSNDDALALDLVADKLARALHATDVVQASLAQGEDRMLELRYRGSGKHLQDLQGVLSGADPIGLSRQLALIIERAVIQATPDENEPVPASDPFVHSARARALQAIAGERWETARRLLRVILDISPDDLWARLEHGRCLAWLRDPLAEPTLEGLLEEARAGQDYRTQTEALHCLAILRHACGRSSDAEQLLSSALKIAEEQHDRESELQLLILLAVVLSGAGSTAVARWMLDRAALLAQVLGNQVASARVIDLRGRLAMLRGDLASAQRDFEAAVDQCEELGLHSSAAFSLTHMGYARTVQGRMKDAADCFERAFRHALKSGQPTAIGQSGLGVLYARSLRVGDVSGAAEVTRKVREGSNSVSAAYADLMDAILAARAGDFETGLEILDRAESGGLAKPTLRAMVLRQRIRLLVCLGLLEEAEDICEELGSCAVGRVHDHLSCVVSHHRGLIAHARGSDADALQLLLASAAERSPVMLERGDPVFDAAWLCLTAGDVARAQSLLANLGDLASSAVDYDYGPALYTMAGLRYATGEVEQAVALQRRYCELAKVVGKGDAGRCLAVYEAAAAGSHSPLPRIGMLPSMCDIVPSLRRPQAGQAARTVAATP
jgi:DNA-binding winged helix-turn-helix (wHTH) protein/tetratricopeptide (TPR) repeat protein